MGKDEYLDWNGRKRKERDHPSKDREGWASNKHTKNPGVKCLADRHKAILEEIKQCIKWNRKRHSGELGSWGRNHLNLCHKKIQKFITELQKRGMTEKVLKYREASK